MTLNPSSEFSVTDFVNSTDAMHNSGNLKITDSFSNNGNFENEWIAIFRGRFENYSNLINKNAATMEINVANHGLLENLNNYGDLKIFGDNATRPDAVLTGHF